MTTLARLNALPKAEIHVHLEGTFAPETLAAWAAQAKVDLPRPVERLFEFAGLANFLQFLDFASGLANTPERLAQLAREFCERLARDGTGYADLIFNPTHWHAWHGQLPAMLDALDAGFREAEQDGLPPVGLCVSLLRTQTEGEAVELVELLTRLRHPRVVALSVDGNEAAAGRTGPRFASAFAQAKAAGLRRTVHAGESSGPEGVRDAVELLQADRIDHGGRAIEDAAVVDLLVQRQIPLGICPTSNVVLKVYPDLDAHPLERLRQAGIPVSLATDDPSLLGATLPGEYARAQQHYGWNDAVLRAVARTSIEASFANADVKADLLARLARW
ncbi:adenosine deaminase [Curvibacter sp. APW13]|uniref:adenosine deaminase n=1 Tax=Curvibacter sp. APW13 TaxID=3077236 RepID=UPI0028DFC4EA|nr:adenosine deaminase [Curvibacter sp. APW13]MDT8990283.1 adenosine deaminase [Curvibacter sp. APW13]